MNATLTPTAPDRAVRWGDFGTLAEGLDYAATQPTGINLYALRGQLAEVLPYARLRTEARDIAAQFLARGLEPGDRVGLAASTDGDFLRAFFACQYAGLVPAPLPLPAPFGGRAAYVAHVRRMLETCRASAAFAAPELAPWFAEAAEGLDLRVCRPFLTARADGADPVGLPTPDAHGLALLQFSSGSTRFPMGIEITQAALIANATTAAVAGLASTAADRTLSWLPLYHDMGLVGFVLMPFLAQASMDLMPTGAFVRRPLLWPELIAANGATMSYSPTFGYDLAARRVDAETLARLDLSRWRVAGVGGDMLRPEPLRAFATAFAPAGFDAKAFTASYGMAEATLAVSMTVGRGLRTETVDAQRLAEAHEARASDGGDAETREFALCGRVLEGHRMEVRGEAGQALADRAVGRIFVRGPSLMRGYFDRPEETAQAISPEGWLDTGDLGYRVGDELVVTGRAKDLIIVNGRNLWPQDLEWTLEDGVPELRTGDVAVFSVWQGGEERVVVVAERRLTEAANDDDLKTRIADLVRSRHGVAVETLLVKTRSLPMTSSGKLSRTKAREMYESGAFAAVTGG